jgi:hypothetical protein
MENQSGVGIPLDTSMAIYFDAGERMISVPYQFQKSITLEIILPIDECRPLGYTLKTSSFVVIEVLRVVPKSE